MSDQEGINFLTENSTEEIIGDTEKCDVHIQKISVFKNGKKVKSSGGLHRENVARKDSKDDSPEGQYEVIQSHNCDLEFVNQDFYDTTESIMELTPEVRPNPTSASTVEVKDAESTINLREGEEEQKTGETSIARMSTIFQSVDNNPTPNLSDRELKSPNNIRSNDQLYHRPVDMCSAIYTVNSVTKEDFLSYQGYTIRTEGADLCINSVVFNTKENVLRIVIKTTEYDQFYRGVVTKIHSQPKILKDEENKWTMLYATLDDDELGVIEIEVPDGVSVNDIKHQGPIQGHIFVDIPQNP